MEKILAGVTAPWDATFSFEYEKANPTLVNDPVLAALLADAFEPGVGSANVLRGGAPTMASEDFAYIARKVPSAFALVGIGGVDGTPMCPPPGRLPVGRPQPAGADPGPGPGCGGLSGLT